MVSAYLVADAILAGYRVVIQDGDDRTLTIEQALFNLV